MEKRCLPFMHARSSDNIRQAQCSIVTKYNHGRPNQHFSRTCPSLYQVNKRATSEFASLKILREFMSRPDGAAHTYTLQDSSSNLEADCPSSQYFSTSQGEGPSRSSHSNPNTRKARTNIPIPNNELPQSLGSSLTQNMEAENSPVKTEYRLCKSEASFEKHQNACTHRNGALALECRFCKRPYTYVGYLHKHEIECAKIARTYSNMLYRPS
ncbi:expressed protein [Phakopsora pachyrhizi]|uniref:Expressed protein n=1 Tax=Phakopsora pachyrhizi TaxID=170000 RepID=A0AAV0AM96_PHAPC|nr:expressed protein [Phakopsora pachyrhizi]